MASMAACHFCGSERSKRVVNWGWTVCANNAGCVRRMKRVEGRCESCNGAHSDCGDA